MLCTCAYVLLRTNDVLFKVSGAKKGFHHLLFKGGGGAGGGMANFKMPARSLPMPLVARLLMEVSAQRLPI